MQKNKQVLTKVCCNCKHCDKTDISQAVVKCNIDKKSIFLTDSCNKFVQKN